MKFTKNEKIILYSSVAVLILTYFFGLFIDVTRDAAKYAYISKEIAQGGNWLKIKILGEPYFQKPQLLFWLSSISFKAFGISNFTFKLPVFLYSLFGFFAVFRLGKCLFDTRTGFLASIIIMFSVISVLYNMDIHTDIVLMTNVSISLWMLIEFLKNAKLKYLIGSGVALGLCILTKGPFGVIIPLFAVLGYILSQKNFKQLFNPDWIIIILIAFAIASPAVIPLYYEKGISGIWFFLWDNNFRRVIGHYNGTINDPVFYVHNLIYLFLPWSFVMFTGVIFQFKNLFKRKFMATDHFVFWGLWLFFILISVSKNKLPNYLLSLIPLLSIITAQGWISIFDKHLYKLIQSQKILLWLTWILIFAIPLFIFPKMKLILWIVLIAFILVTFIMIKTKNKENKLLLQTLVTAISLVILLNFHIASILFNLQGSPVAANIINQQAEIDAKVYYLFPKDIVIRDEQILKSKLSTDHFIDIFTELHFYRNYEFMFYSEKPVQYIEDLADLKEITSSGNAWIYTDEMGKNEAYKYHSEKISAIPVKHFNLKRTSRYINPKTRDSSFEKMYLLHIIK